MKPVLPHLFSLFIVVGNVHAVSTFTENFNSSPSNWFNGGSSAPTYTPSGGIGNTGYIAYTMPAKTVTGGAFSANATELMFRANDAADASSDAFVGNWIMDGVQTFTISVIHDHTTSLDFYIRIAGVGGAGASLAEGFSIAPNIWTPVSFPITNTNPPFVSFGASTFSGVFSDVQNMQLGLYLPAGDYPNLTMGIDNVAITAVPEPSALALFGPVGLGLLLRRRGR